MRVLLGGIIGATVAVAALLGLEYVTQMDLGWLSCGVGVVTGFCVHCAAGPRSGGSFVRGGLSVLLALVAIVGGRLAYAKVMEANMGEVPVVIATTEPGATIVQEEATEESMDTSQQSALREDRSVAPVGKGPIATPSIKLSFSQLDMLWMSLAALAAYIIGKGRDEVQPTAASEEPQSETQSPSTNGE
jgi:hypothetical protein